jgi:hypothetical protein
MTEDWAGPEGAGLLRALGQVEPPVPGVLEAAREVLWSAVAGEMLSAGAAGGAGRARAAGTDRSRDDSRRHRTEPGS